MLHSWWYVEHPGRLEWLQNPLERHSVSFSCIGGPEEAWGVRSEARGDEQEACSVGAKPAEPCRRFLRQKDGRAPQEWTVGHATTTARHAVTQCIPAKGHSADGNRSQRSAHSTGTGDRREWSLHAEAYDGVSSSSRKVEKVGGRCAHAVFSSTSSTGPAPARNLQTPPTQQQREVAETGEKWRTRKQNAQKATPAAHQRANRARGVCQAVSCRNRVHRWAVAGQGREIWPTRTVTCAQSAVQCQLKSLLVVVCFRFFFLFLSVLGGVPCSVGFIGEVGVGVKCRHVSLVDCNCLAMGHTTPWLSTTSLTTPTREQAVPPAWHGHGCPRPQAEHAGCAFSFRPPCCATPAPPTNSAHTKGSCAHRK